jgi:hypothetical protein
MMLALTAAGLMRNMHCLRVSRINCKSVKILQGIYDIHCIHAIWLLMIEFSEHESGSLMRCQQSFIAVTLDLHFHDHTLRNIYYSQRSQEYPSPIPWITHFIGYVLSAVTYFQLLAGACPHSALPTINTTHHKHDICHTRSLPPHQTHSNNDVHPAPSSPLLRAALDQMPEPPKQVCRCEVA